MDNGVGRRVVEVCNLNVARWSRRRMGVGAIDLVIYKDMSTYINSLWRRAHLRTESP